MPRVGQRDYTAELAAITSDIEDVADDVAVVDDLVDFLVLEARHETHLWPEDSDEVCTLTAGAVNNAFSDWAELDIDGDGDTLSSKFADDIGHLSAVSILHVETTDVEYILEIAYGDDRTNIARQLFMARGVYKLAGVFFQRIRAQSIPAGETVYYRMKCAAGGNTCEISVRYHFD
ncbi:MAG: hypothetical protein KAT75_00620 [Dehalococcoidia bacterium]|nr:hypothetical protein [Dehalococcoidia bacterium]